MTAGRCRIGVLFLYPVIDTAEPYSSPTVIPYACYAGSINCSTQIVNQSGSPNLPLHNPRESHPDPLKYGNFPHPLSLVPLFCQSHHARVAVESPWCQHVVHVVIGAGNRTHEFQSHPEITTRKRVGTTKPPRPNPDIYPCRVWSHHSTCNRP
jgi:hypothetical protein